MDKTTFMVLNKPCPFCGGEASLRVQKKGIDACPWAYDIYIKCGTCNLIFESIAIEEYVDDEILSMVDQWNQRTETAEIKLVIDISVPYITASAAHDQISYKETIHTKKSKERIAQFFDVLTTVFDDDDSKSPNEFVSADNVTGQKVEYSD